MRLLVLKLLQVKVVKVLFGHPDIKISVHNIFTHLYRTVMVKFPLHCLQQIYHDRLRHVGYVGLL